MQIFDVITFSSYAQYNRKQLNQLIFVRWVPGSWRKEKLFLPSCHGDYQSSHFLHVRTDCALFYFTCRTYSYSDNTTIQRKTHCGKLTAGLVIVFLARFFMQRIDVESNPCPGPGSKYNFRGGMNSLQTERGPREFPRHSSVQQLYPIRPDPRY